MNSRSKKIDSSGMLLKHPSGSALTVVIFFASFAMISVMTYVMHQIMHMKPSFSVSSNLQALFNARSGVYRALYQLVDSVSVDTLPTISPLDSAFGSSLFGDLPDTVAPPPEKPQMDGTPIVYQLFPEDSLGECEVSVEPAGGSCLMRSVGRYRSFERTVTAILGCRIPALPDTVAMVTNNDPWKGNPPQGTVVYGADIVSANRSWFSGIVDRYRTDITDADTFLLDAPLIIQSAHDLKKIGHIVNGPLLIDGAHVGMKWRDTGTVIVRGDLQITGEVEIRDIDFIVAGEIKLLDEADLSGSDLFTQSRIFIGDRSRFEGNALAMHSITVYGNASIRGKSSLIAGSAEGQQGSGDSSKYSILLSEECEVDAVCIALGGRGSIKSDLESSLSGILWAEQTVCHRGRMKGLICAGRLVDCDDPGQSSPDIDSGGTSGSGVAGEKCNGMSGELEPLDEIASYSLPFFLGRLSIVRWEE